MSVVKFMLFASRKFSVVEFALFLNFLFDCVFAEF